MDIKETNLQFGTLSARAATKKVLIHHAAATNCDAKTIHQWHINQGWAGIGYHFVVRKNGTIERGRAESTIGAHCTGQNSDSIGICFEGNFEKEQMTDAQKQAGKELISYLLDKYNLKSKDVYRHSHFLATSCPGKNFLFEEIRKGATKKKLKKGAKVKIKSGAKDLNTKKKYSDFVYSTEYVVHKVAATYVVFGNGTTAVGKTRKKNVIVQ